MTKIAITNHGHRMNKGTAALLNSRIKTLKKYIPDAEFAVFTYHPERDYKPEMKYIKDVKIRFYEVPCKVSLSPRTVLKTFHSILRLLFCNSKLVKKLNVKSIQEYSEADVIISTGGDVLTEDYGSISFFNYVANLLLGILLEKPVILYAESIGPFKRRLNRIIARFLLNRVRLVTLRERISREYLEKLGIDKAPMYVTADSAFLLEPAPIQRVKEILEIEGLKEDSRPLVGISVSKIISRYGFHNLITPDDKYSKYLKLMAQIVDYLIESLNATVVFIPHVVEPWGNDDRTVAYDIYKLIEGKHKTVVIKNEYTAEEVKGMIGQCDLFIGARMHATIASTSMHVPTVAIAYSHKTHGIIGEMLGYNEYVLDVQNLNYETLASATSNAWNNRTKIRKELVSKMEDIKQAALLNGKLVKELIEHLSES